MSEKIYLRVPSKPAAEEVSHGNFSAKLKPKSVITVDHRRFADWLVREWGCAEIDKPKTESRSKPKPKAAKKDTEKKAESAPAKEEETPADAAAADDEGEDNGGLE